MAQKSTQIQIPDRRADEPEASPEQLQVIRQLVAGMSLSGFRFDYRRLGADQAKSIIDQLLAIRNAQGISTPKNSGRGCLGTIAAMIRGLGTAVIILLVLGAIGGGVFLYYNVENGKLQAFIEGLGDKVGVDLGLESRADSEEENEDTTPDENDGLVDSLLFDGLKVEDYPDPNEPGGDDTDTTNPRSGDNDNPVTVSPEPVGPEPVLNLAAQSEIKEIEYVLVRVSQFTRTEYSQSLRQPSVERIHKKLATLGKGMTAIKTLNPDLFNRINAIIDRYGEPEIDGQAMRDEINAIRADLKALK